MRQLTLSTVNFDKHRKVTRRGAFLAEMERVVPWRELCAVCQTALNIDPRSASKIDPSGVASLCR